MRKLLLILFITPLFISCGASKSSPFGIFPTKKGQQKYTAAYNKSLKALWNVTYKEDNVRTRFGTAHVLISGPENGKPVILLHGTDASSIMWYPNVKALSAKYRVYAIDFPMEAGKSIATVPEIDNGDILKFYNEVFDHYALKDMTLIGASRGGWIATYLAIQENSGIRKLVLLSPAQTFTGIDQLGKALTGLTLKLFPKRKRLNKFFDQFSFYPKKIRLEYKEQFYLANKFAHSKPGLTKMKRFSDDEIKKLQIPVLVLIGDHDIINDEKCTEKAAELLPQAETGIIKDAGHFLSVDQADVINKRILEFMAKK
ncbi:alpha/beta fold hydrolase [Flavobacterium sp. 3HN19-14]|uniref:alpha/beta fold hydrolase n=1 Tax=Flavobacterium sp. 3HN19-14 TaxID=3448133 RepID=UPI003EE24D05